MDDIFLMNARAEGLARKLGKNFNKGDEEKDAEIILDADRAISICLNGGFLVVEGLDRPIEEDVSVTPLETEQQVISFIGDIESN